LFYLVIFQTLRQGYAAAALEFRGARLVGDEQRSGVFI
jgi:hypothetical protein